MHSGFIYFWLAKRIAAAESDLAIPIAALAGGIGCALACLVSEKASKDRTYVNAIMSDSLEAMEVFRDFLAQHQITNVAADTYTLHWNGWEWVLYNELARGSVVRWMVNRGNTPGIS